MASGTIEMKFVSVGLKDPSVKQIEMQIEWAKANGLDAMEIASPCLVNLTTKTIVAHHRVLAEDGSKFLSAERKHDLLVDPPEEICRRG